MNLLLALLLIIGKAMCDAIRDEAKEQGDLIKKKRLQKIYGTCSALYFGSLVLMIYSGLYGRSELCQIDHYWITIAGFVLLYYGSFSLWYNLFRWLPWYFLGTTKWFDITLQKIMLKYNVSVGIYGLSMLISTCIGMAFLFGARFGLVPAIENLIQNWKIIF